MTGSQRTLAFACALVVLAGVALIRVAGADAGRHQLERDLGRLKGRLGTVVLVGDFLIVEDVAGEPDKVYVAECRRQGDWLLQELAKKLAGRKYRVEARPLLSVGMAAPPELTLARLERWEQHREDVDRFPVEYAPFHLNPIVRQDEGGPEAWQGLVRAVWTQARRDGWSGEPVVPVDSTLRAALGADCLMVVVGYGVQVPIARGMLISTVADPRRTEEGPCSTDYRAFSIFRVRHAEGWRLSLALLDARSGRVLWCNSACDGTISIHGKPGWTLRSEALRGMP